MTDMLTANKNFTAHWDGLKKLSLAFVANEIDRTDYTQRCMRELFLLMSPDNVVNFLSKYDFDFFQSISNDKKQIPVQELTQVYEELSSFAPIVQQMSDTLNPLMTGNNSWEITQRYNHVVIPSPARWALQSKNLASTTMSSMNANFLWRLVEGYRNTIALNFQGIAFAYASMLSGGARFEE